MIKAAVIGLGWWGKTILGQLSNSTVIRPVLGEAPYLVALDEMLANARSFEAVHRSVRSGTIEVIECG